MPVPLSGNKALIEAYPQAGRYHVICGKSISCGKPHIRLEVIAANQAVQVCILVRRGLDKRFLFQIGQWEGFPSCLLMCFRQPYHQLICGYRDPVTYSRSVRLGTETAVNGFFINSFGHILIATFLNPYAHPWVFLFKSGKYLRQP